MIARLGRLSLLLALGLGPACVAKFQVTGDENTESGTDETGNGTESGGDSCEVNCDDQREICDGDQCLCRSGLTRCGDTCVDLESDPTHCGDCNVDCGADVCESGECRVGDCQDGELTNCDGACVDTDEDPLHCNGCNRPCKSNELCIDANCREFDPGDCESDEACDDGRKCCPAEEGESMICIEGDSCP